jgi:hypothetical protein
MESNILTLLQRKVLVALFKHGLANRGYYLTGGMALSAFYLKHRLSDDLDLFTRKHDSLENDFRDFSSILILIGLTIMSQDISNTYARFFVDFEDANNTPLKIEFARDVPAQWHQPIFMIRSPWIPLKIFL